MKNTKIASAYSTANPKSRSTYPLTEKIDILVREYKADPNCRPGLWIAGENVTAKERKYFISKTV